MKHTMARILHNESKAWTQLHDIITSDINVINVSILNYPNTLTAFIRMFSNNQNDFEFSMTLLIYFHSSPHLGKSNCDHITHSDVNGVLEKSLIYLW